MVTEPDPAPHRLPGDRIRDVSWGVATLGLTVFGLLWLVNTPYRQVYVPRMDDVTALADGLLLRPGAHWQEPKGGMFFWVELLAEIDTGKLLKTAVEFGVAFVPGSSFFAEDPMNNTMRLNYTHNDANATIEGMNRMTKAMEGVLIK